jgi:hypothetical protein
VKGNRHRYMNAFAGGTPDSEGVSIAIEVR